MVFVGFNRRRDADATVSHLTKGFRLSRRLDFPVIIPVFLLAAAIIEYLLIPVEQFRLRNMNPEKDEIK